LNRDIQDVQDKENELSCKSCKSLLILSSSGLPANLTPQTSNLLLPPLYIVQMAHPTGKKVMDWKKT
jgi:hypothetical protein